MKNLLTDIAGVKVGHADDPKLASGVTAVVFDQPAVAAMDVRNLMMTSVCVVSCPARRRASVMTWLRMRAPGTALFWLE